MSIFNVTISGLDTLEKDFADEIFKIEKKIPDALQTVGDQMIANLQTHITNEWYHGYKPKAYKRRSDDSSLGTPLGSEDYMDAKVIGGNTLDFVYLPKGDHKNKAWHRRDDDELIESIQTGSLKGDPPPRNFWNSFLYDQERVGIINAFISGMAPDYVVIPECDDVEGVVTEGSLASLSPEVNIYEAYDPNDPNLPD